MNSWFKLTVVLLATLLMSACAATNDSPNSVDYQNASPISIPTPAYPAAATHRNLHGQCDVEFDIDPQGQTQNIMVSCDHEVFVQPAREAIENWRYNPRIRNGEATWRNGVVTSFDFRTLAIELY